MERINIIFNYAEEILPRGRLWSQRHSVQHCNYGTINLALTLVALSLVDRIGGGR